MGNRSASILENFFFTRKQKLSIIDKIKKIQLKKTYFKKGLRNSKHWSWNDGWGSNFYSRWNIPFSLKYTILAETYHSCWNIPFSLKYTTQSKLWGFQIVSFAEWLWNYTCLSGLQKMIVIQQTFLRPAVTASMPPPFSGTKLILNYMAWWKKQKAIWYFHYFSWAISLRKIIFCFTVSNESPAVSCIPSWFFFSLLLWAEISIYLEFVSR